MVYDLYYSVKGLTIAMTLYCISYKGKRYGSPMTKEEAVNKLSRMEHLFVGLELVESIPSEDEEAGYVRSHDIRKLEGRSGGSGIRS